MRKLLAILFVLVFSLSLIGLVACQPVQGNTDNTDTDQQQSHVDYGTLTIGNVTDLEVGTSVQLSIEFSMPEHEGEITYTYDEEYIVIDEGYVFAVVGNKTINVTATTDKLSTTFTVTTASCGELLINDVYAWVDYPASDFYVDFTMPKYEEELTFTYDEEALFIDEEKMTIKALQEGKYTVTASSLNFNTEFTVNAQVIDRDYRFSANNFASQANVRAAKWESDGNDGKTTVFIGDSFFDSAIFWTDFYSRCYPGKDALCLGISATTTYDWEDWINGWLGQTNPKNIVMHMGTNNVYDDADDFKTAVSSLQRMFTLMHDKLPETNIYWFSITQRVDTSGKYIVTKTNEAMRVWCQEREWITYIHTVDSLPGDKLKDGIHPKLENYDVFTQALENTGIVIEDLAGITDPTIADISITTSQSIAQGTGISNIKYKGANLNRNFILSGKLDITSRLNNSHVQFGINGNMDRVLLWDNTSIGEYKICIPYNTNGIPAEDIKYLTNGQTLTIEWKVIMTDDDLYYFWGDELKIVYTGLGGGEFVVGAEATACKFYDMTALTLTNDAEDYTTALAEYNDIISQYGNMAATKIRV